MNQTGIILTRQYSPEVHRLFNELDNKILWLLCFLCGGTFSAMLKGYLDRVWNYGLAMAKMAE